MSSLSSAASKSYIARALFSSFLGIAAAPPPFGEGSEPRPDLKNQLNDRIEVSNIPSGKFPDSYLIDHCKVSKKPTQGCPGDRGHYFHLMRMKLGFCQVPECQGCEQDLVPFLFSTLVSCKESWMALARSSSSCWLLTTRGSWWRIFYYPPDWCCLTNEKYFLSFSTKPKKVRSVMQLFDLPVGAQISFWDLPPRCWSQYLPSFKRHTFITYSTQQLCWIKWT